MEAELVVAGGLAAAPEEPAPQEGGTCRPSRERRAEEAGPHERPLTAPASRALGLSNAAAPDQRAAASVCGAAPESCVAAQRPRRRRRRKKAQIRTSVASARCRRGGQLPGSRNQPIPSFVWFLGMWKGNRTSAPSYPQTGSTECRRLGSSAEYSMGGSEVLAGHRQDRGRLSAASGPAV